MRTPLGRVATRNAYLHFGINPPHPAVLDADSLSLFNQPGPQ